MNNSFNQESKKVTGVKSVGEIMAEYFKDKKEGKPIKNLQEWQIWFFDFCEKYKIEDRKSIMSLLSVVSRYRNALTWWRWLDSYLSDYPNISKSPVGLVFFLFKKAKDDGKFKNVQLFAADGETLAYRKVRRDIKRFKRDRFDGSAVKNAELLEIYIGYHQKLIGRYEASERDVAPDLAEKHKNVLIIVDKYKGKLLKGVYKI